MRIAVIGYGNVGGTLGRRWAESGHSVTFAVRDENNSKLDELLAVIKGDAKRATIRDAVAHADVLVLAIPAGSAEEVLRQLGDLGGKVLIDATNPVGNNGLSYGWNTSQGEKVAAWATNARVVKAFNTIPARNLGTPRFGDETLSVFLAGDDSESKQVVKKLAEDIGFEAFDTGTLTMARYLEPMVMVLVNLAYKQGHGDRIAFKLLKQ